MGILNVTPDSFYDGGIFPDMRSRLQRIEEMINEGASIIDIGGSSTRPGAAEVKPEEERKRIGPLLSSVRKNFPDICISVDTYHASVAREAIDIGVNMVNDISGGSFDKEMAPLIGKHNLPFVIMHIQGRPGNMQKDPFYEDVVEEITVFFEKQIKLFQAHGANHLILDPGFGFGKTLAHNYSILKNLDHFKALDYPLLAGHQCPCRASRPSVERKHSTKYHCTHEWG